MDRITWIKAQDTTAEKATELYQFYDDYCNKFGTTSFETFKRYCRDAVKPEEVEVTAKPQLTKTIVTDEKQETTVLYSEIMGVEDLAKASNIDLDVWEPEKIVNGRYTDKYFQIKAFWRRKNPSKMSVKDYAKRFNDLVNIKSLPYKIQKREVVESGKMAQICLFDFHFGQLSWDEETKDGNYNIEIAAELMEQTVDYYIKKLERDPVEIIEVPVGNDFFNTDNPFNTTYAGTPQAESDRWKKVFFSAENLYIQQIDKLSKIAPVNIKIIPGNHDRTRAFFLGEFLRAWYRNDDNVTVDNNANEMKFTEWGQNMLMYTHGDGLHANALPMLMVQENPQMFGRTKYHTIYKGHWHAGQDKAYRVSKESNGIKEIVIPSLVPLDDYHKGKGYRHIREAVMNVFDKERGIDATYYFHP